MQKTVRRILIGLCAAPMVLGLMAQEMPRTTKQSVKGAASAKTEQLRGTVVFVEGNRLVVKMSTGDLRTFEVPDERRFIIDGKELKVNELQPGTTLTATVTTTTTPVTERTTTIGTGKVWFVSGNSVILTLPNNENRMYKVNENYRFMVNGQKASVHDLRKGMTIAAEKIVEEPRTEIASNVAVTGSAPPRPQPVRTEVARAPEPKPRPAPAVTRAPASAPPPAAAPEPAPTPVETETAPAELPKTGSPVPIFGLAGVFLMGASLALRSLRTVF
jgi:LPXTG-motif cell wall-anchored protein